jgi:hypothetical protein
MVEESLEFAKQALAVGAQPTRLRGLLLKQYDSHLISKDLINLKQSLTGRLQLLLLEKSLVQWVQ